MKTRNFSDEINITKNKFRGEWNDSIAPAGR